MRQQALRISHYFPACVLLLCMPVWLGACVEPTVNNVSWIELGKTTKAEVIAQYGEPDLVMAGQDGETAIYRPVVAQRVPPPVQIPTAQVGPLGTTRTQMETIEPGFGRGEKASRRPDKETRIRYDAQGMVQEVLQ